MATQGQLLQWVHQVAAVAALLRQGEVLAQASILMREAGQVTGLGLALLQLFQLCREGLPLGLVTVFEEALFHVGPNRPRATPLSCSTARAGDTCKGVARIEASS